MLYKSPRSGRVYGEPVEIDGALYVEILYAPGGTLLPAGEVVRWWEPTFPPGYMRAVPPELEAKALAGGEMRELFPGW